MNHEKKSARPIRAKKKAPMAASSLVHLYRRSLEPFERGELIEMLVGLLVASRQALLTRSLEPVAEELNSILATAEVVSDPDISRAIMEAERDLKNKVELVDGKAFLKSLLAENE